ncbi:MAG: PilT/PilU family type 4a pilus ATPase [Verrucomicrobiota bacterium]
MSSGRDLVDLLTMTRGLNGSDLHLSVGAPPVARVDGALVPLGDELLEPKECREFIMSVLTESERSRLEKNWELDFALQIRDVGRFRGNAHFSRGNLEAAFRYVPSEVPDLETLGHGPTVRDFCRARQGLVLVTGMAGAGKSTTLAAMTAQILNERNGVVTTIEDPIEFTFPHATSLIKQRQIGMDTQDFAKALKAAVRQDVDVVVVSEMRDQESVAAALTAAETGHLVISTLHSRGSIGSLDRMVDIFPAAQQPQIITQLAGTLVGIVHQKLLPRADIPGRVMASEVMVLTPALSAVIRDHRFEQIYGLMQVSAVHGMHTMDNSLLHLLKGGFISLENALLHARDVALLKADFQEWLRTTERAKR